MDIGNWGLGKYINSILFYFFHLNLFFHYIFILYNIFILDNILTDNN